MVFAIIIIIIIIITNWRRQNIAQGAAPTIITATNEGTADSFQIDGLDIPIYTSHPKRLTTCLRITAPPPPPPSPPPSPPSHPRAGCSTHLAERSEFTNSFLIEPGIVPARVAIAATNQQSPRAPCFTSSAFTPYKKRGIDWRSTRRNRRGVFCVHNIISVGALLIQVLDAYYFFGVSQQPTPLAQAAA